MTHLCGLDPRKIVLLQEIDKNGDTLPVGNSYSRERALNNHQNKPNTDRFKSRILDKNTGVLELLQYPSGVPFSVLPTIPPRESHSNPSRAPIRSPSCSNRVIFYSYGSHRYLGKTKHAWCLYRTSTPPLFPWYIW